MQLSEHQRAAIGGPRAISLQAWAWNAPLAILAIPITQSMNPRVLDWMRWLVASGVGYLAAGLCLWALSYTALRRRHTQPVHPILVVAAGALAGFTKATVTFQAVAALGIPSVQTPMRVINATVIGATMLPIGAMVFAALDEVQHGRHELLEQRIALAQAEYRDAHLASELASLMQEAFGTSVDVNRSTRPGTDPGLLDNLTRADATTIAMTQRRLQRLSRNLWDRAPNPEVRLHLLDVLGLCTAKVPLSPTAVSVIYVLGSAQTGIQLFGLRSAVLLAFVNGLAILCTARLASALVQRHPSAALPITAVVAAALGAALGSEALAVTSGQGFRLAFWLIPYTALLVTGLSLLTSVVSVALAQPSSLLDHLQRELEEAQVHAWAAQRERGRITRQFATFLHGTVQTKLLAATLLKTEGDRHSLSHLSRSLADDIDRLLNVDVDLVSPSLTSIVAAWDGLIDVEWHGSDASLPQDRSSHLAVVLEEAIANAVRHGSATRITVSLAVSADTATLRVQDNGNAAFLNPPGLGTALFNSRADTAWSLVDSGDGALFTYELSLTGAAPL